MHKYFIRFHFFVQNNKVTSIGIALLFLFVFGFFASKIKFEEDITRIIPKNERTDATTKVLKQLNFADKITVIIEKWLIAENILWLSFYRGLFVSILSVTLNVVLIGKYGILGAAWTAVICQMSFVALLFLFEKRGQ